MFASVPKSLSVVTPSNGFPPPIPPGGGERGKRATPHKTRRAASRKNKYKRRRFRSLPPFDKGEKTNRGTRHTHFKRQPHKVAQRQNHPAFGANSFPKVTNRICRLPLVYFFDWTRGYSPEGRDADIGTANKPRLFPPEGGKRMCVPFQGPHGVHQTAQKRRRHARAVLLLRLTRFHNDSPIQIDLGRTENSTWNPAWRRHAHVYCYHFVTKLGGTRISTCFPFRLDPPPPLNRRVWPSTCL